jgi:hypothetical protein
MQMLTPKPKLPRLFSDALCHFNQLTEYEQVIHTANDGEQIEVLKTQLKIAIPLSLL